MSTNDTIDLLRDQTGEGIMKYQSAVTANEEDVFFLTGATRMSVTRNVTVPANETIFLPIINFYRSCANCNTFQQVFGLKDTLLASRDGNIQEINIYANATLDGKALKPQRVTSDLFELNGAPTVTDGYYIIVDLDAGNHTLHTQGRDIHGYWNDVRYNLSVK